MPYRPTYKDEVDQRLLNFMTITEKQESSFYSYHEIENWNSILELVRRTGLRIGAVRNSLKRLTERELVLRCWHGNARYGRHLYAQKAALISGPRRGAS